ncbi:hypothetical protein IWX50DRAFT_666539 [Phyllosticta citricarpa]|uniref:Uncharacterized protein n=1 Tax=Phyllosticta citricarpa TaxID=55181 RepID=A0ABR1MGZ4_9PEZI
MAHKRKRSDSTSSPLSSSSLFSRSSSPPCIDMDDAPVADPMAASWTWPSQQQQPQPRENISGRNLKRFRDDRPDERIIHAESTLRRLYDAQRHVSAPNAPSETDISAPGAPVSVSVAAQFPQQQLVPVQKSTLHQFWHISKPPVQPPDTSIPAAALKDTAALRCDDCDVSLVGYYGVGMNMDVDLDECVCRRCEKTVCAACSVFGNERRCLNCAVY